MRSNANEYFMHMIARINYLSGTNNCHTPVPFREIVRFVFYFASQTMDCLISAKRKSQWHWAQMERLKTWYRKKLTSVYVRMRWAYSRIKRLQATTKSATTQNKNRPKTTKNHESLTHFSALVSLVSPNICLCELFLRLSSP